MMAFWPATGDEIVEGRGKWGGVVRLVKCHRLPIRGVLPVPAASGDHKGAY